MKTNKNKISIIGIIACIIVIGIIYAFIPYMQSLNSNNKDPFSDLEVNPSNASYIVVGNSYVIVPPHAKVVTQVDRVIRDKLSHYNESTKNKYIIIITFFVINWTYNS